MVNKAAIVAELQKRKAKAALPQFAFGSYCFDAQQDFFRNDSGNRFHTGVCSRRAGKTVGIVADMFGLGQTEKRQNLLYITISQTTARAIIWGDIEHIKDHFGLDDKTVKLDHQKLTVTFPKTKVKIYIRGVKDRSEIEKFRGWRLKKCYIDECQSMRSYIKELIDDVIIPALRDERGHLYLTGTPGPVKTGAFYKYSTSKTWDNHHWTAFDNPHMHNPEGKFGLPVRDLNVTLAEEREVKEIDENDPSYIRETFGLWVEDEDTLVFKFSREKNRYEALPTEGEWTYIMGVDIGYEDSDAIAVLGYNSWAKKVFIVEEYCKNKQTISDLMRSVIRIKDKYNPVKIVMDAGALGKKIQEEIRQRHGIHMEAAEKSRKIEFIELLNDDLRTGKLLAKHNPEAKLKLGELKYSLFEEDCFLVQWDKDSILRNPERPKVSSEYHSDICDAVLYAWRECRHYLSEKPPETPNRDTDEYMNQLEAKESEEFERARLDPQGHAFDKQTEDDAEQLEMLLDTFD